MGGRMFPESMAECYRNTQQTPDLEKRIHKLGVIPSMGYCFGEEGKGCIRLNLGCPKSVLKEKIYRLKNILQSTQ